MKSCQSSFLPMKIFRTNIIGGKTPWLSGSRLLHKMKCFISNLLQSTNYKFHAVLNQQSYIHMYTPSLLLKISDQYASTNWLG